MRLSGAACEYGAAHSETLLQKRRVLAANKRTSVDSFDGDNAPDYKNMDLIIRNLRVPAFLVADAESLSCAPTWSPMVCPGCRLPYRLAGLQDPDGDARGHCLGCSVRLVGGVRDDFR
jgi:hypothetical protein